MKSTNRRKNLLLRVIVGVALCFLAIRSSHQFLVIDTTPIPTGRIRPKSSDDIGDVVKNQDVSTSEQVNDTVTTQDSLSILYGNELHLEGKPYAASSLPTMVPYYDNFDAGLPCKHEELNFAEKFVHNWDRSKVPVLISAVLDSQSKETYLLFRFPTRELKNLRPLQNATWKCNDHSANGLPTLDIEERQLYAFNFLLVVCPAELEESKQPLTQVTLVMNNNENKTVVYDDLKDWWRCQIFHHPVTKILHTPVHNVLSVSTNGGTTTKILPHVVVSTMIKGSMPQAYLPQWIEYHRQVFGIAHFFVYVNEEMKIFQSRASYQEWDFVTYVSFPMWGLRRNYYQRVQQNDVLYRVKALQNLSRNSNSVAEECGGISKDPTTLGSQIQWIGMFDIDEYVYSEVDHSPLNRSTFLDELLCRYFTNSKSPVSGVLMLNTFYSGENVTKENTVLETEKGAAALVMLCNFTWRSRSWPIDEEGWSSRQKFFVRPDVATYVNVHNILSTGTGMNTSSSEDYAKLIPSNVQILDPDRELRINHFKIFYKKTQKPDHEDRRMKDEYCEFLERTIGIKK